MLASYRSARNEAEMRNKKEEFNMGPACETDSWWEYQSNIRKCKSSKRAPPEKLIYPLTAQQEVSSDAVERCTLSYHLYLIGLYTPLFRFAFARHGRSAGSHPRSGPARPRLAVRRPGSPPR